MKKSETAPTNCYEALLLLERVHGYLRINYNSGIMGPWRHVVEAKLELEDEMNRARDREMYKAVERFAVSRTG